MAIEPMSGVPQFRVALETTLLVHGVPLESSVSLLRELQGIVRRHGAEPALVGVVRGKPVVGMSEMELEEMLIEHRLAAQKASGPGHERASSGTPKLNTANLGAALSLGWSGATTVSTTMELAAGAGVRVFATGGIGGVHEGYGMHLDISSDLVAFTRFPVAVVTAGVKSILDVASTREMLETLGVPVIGYKTDVFPAFYQREADGGVGVDARFDDMAELARYVAAELARTRRGIVIANPIPREHEVSRRDWENWLDEARMRVMKANIRGRQITPALLKELHERSGGATLRANIELVKHNAAVAAELARAMVVTRPVR